MCFKPVTKLWIPVVNMPSPFKIPPTVKPSITIRKKNNIPLSYKFNNIYVTIFPSFIIARDSIASIDVTVVINTVCHSCTIVWSWTCLCRFSFVFEKLIITLIAAWYRSIWLGLNGVSSKNNIVRRVSRQLWRATPVRVFSLEKICRWISNDERMVQIKLSVSPFVNGY